MPMIEVDENQFHNDRKVVELVQKMLAKPSARRKVLEAHKDIDPNVAIPEIDAAEPVKAAVEAATKQMSDFIAEQRKRDAERDEEAKKREFIGKFEQGRDLLRGYGVTAEGLAKVEELMTSAGIVDHEIGYAAFSKLNPEPEPAPPAPNFGFGGIFNADKNPDEFIKSMHASKGNDESAMDKHIHEILQDVRKTSAPVPQRSQFGRR